jgi:3-oxoacyl-[acyl-carrier protein] reductase
MAKQHGGRIINMASIVGVTGNAGQANYVASKAGLIGLTKTAAKEYAARNVTVNAVAPGFIETDMTAVLPEKSKPPCWLRFPWDGPGKSRMSPERWRFLASDAAAYMTGQVLHVSGGMFM